MTPLAVERNSSSVNTSFDRRKCTKIFAKLGIASGLLSLLASVIVYGVEENIYKLIETNSAINQQLYRLKTIDEYDYHTHLKYATLQKLCKISSYNGLKIMWI